VIEHHEGTTERYLGDALIGLFGVTKSRGDDALRAARAAVALGDDVAGLRLGIESGEVFVGTAKDGAPVPTGGVIAAAARLAEQAAPGEILVGEQIRREIAVDARIEAASGRLLELLEEPPALARTAHTPFVGRARELGSLLDAFAQARDAHDCHLVTVVGPPGIGKSRLAGEFVAAVGEDALVLAGRCATYGEGTAYDALTGIVRGLGGDPQARVGELLAGDAPAIRGVLAALGLLDEPVHAQESAWAMRRLLERVARDGPVVVAVEDIHWASPVLLDLLDHLVALSSGSPILLLCMSRPELLETRPAWAAPQPGRSILLLGALADAQARELAHRLGAEERAARIVQRAEGNPLFVEQLVAVGPEGDEDALPSGIHAVLAARLDQLEEGERMLLQHAAVEGRTFHAGAVASTLPASDEHAMDERLVALARKGLISADQPEFAGEDGFRFTHALIRDAAYAGIPKQLRAELHTQVADWLEARLATDEVIGHHLELACRLEADLGHSGDIERALAGRAVNRLEAASRVALLRRDAAAASDLLERAIALVPSDAAARGALAPDLGAALFEAGRTTEATRILDDAIATARQPEREARARVEREFVRLGVETSAGTERARRVADEALPVLERSGDARGQCRAWALHAKVAWIAGRVEDADAGWVEAAACARRAGDEQELFAILGERATAAVLGPTPVGEAIRRCEEFRELVAGSSVAVTWMINPLASLHAMRGDNELADTLVNEANATLRQLGSLGASVSHHEALVMLLTGRPELAERSLRAGIDRLSAMDEHDLHATTNAMLAQAVYAQGRLPEADRLCDAATADASADDIVTNVIWRGVKAKVLAHQGRGNAGETLAREAVAMLEPTDLLSHHGDAMLDLAEVLTMCSRTDEVDEALGTALSLYEEKGNAAAAAKARSQLGDRRGGI
jgi:tetratricopeptide (TPR) repeat protein